MKPKSRTIAQVKTIVRYCRKQFTLMDGSPYRTIRRIGREKYREIIKELCKQERDFDQ